MKVFLCHLLVHLGHPVGQLIRRSNRHIDGHADAKQLQLKVSLAFCDF
jgi:hypothetical protein